MTLIQIIEQSATRLDAAGVSFGHGTSNAFDEACWLVLWRLGLPLDELEAVADRPLSPESVRSVESLVQLRMDSRKPAAYLTQEAWLQGIPFYVDERCIVPRSLIAELIVQGVLDPWLPPDAQRALDLCTGGASLAILAAQSYPQLCIDASDLSADALVVARINLRRHGLESRVQLIQADGLPPLASSSPYDLILCNPPYVNAQSMMDLPAEYRSEPALALAGGKDGMDFIRVLLAQAAACLNDQGLLVLEIGHERAHFEAAFPHLSALWLETSGGADQVLLLQRDGLTAS